MQPLDDDFIGENSYNNHQMVGPMADEEKEMGEAKSNADPSHSGGGFFEIQVKGQLNSRWSEWLEGLEVKLLENGEMILFGPIVDQAALMGVLNKLSRLNLTLLSLHQKN
jgi:hypothetical protein